MAAHPVNESEGDFAPPTPAKCTEMTNNLALSELSKQ